MRWFNKSAETGLPRNTRGQYIGARISNHPFSPKTSDSTSCVVCSRAREDHIYQPGRRSKK